MPRIPNARLALVLVVTACGGGPTPAPEARPNAGQQTAAPSPVEPHAVPAAPMSVPPALTIERVVVLPPTTLRAGLQQALTSPGAPIATAPDVALLARRADGDCTYALGLESQGRLLRWILAVRERGLSYGVVARWGSGGAALAIEGLGFVGACPVGAALQPLHFDPDPDRVTPRAVGSTGLVVDVPRRYQAVANGGRFSFEDLGDALPLAIYRDPAAQGDLERFAAPGPGVTVETRELEGPRSYVRRAEGGRTSIYVAVDAADRWLCGCDATLESVCVSLRPAP